MTDEIFETISVEDTDAGKRLDKFLSEQLSAHSRERLKQLILQGQVSVEQSVVTTPSFRLSEGDEISLIVPPAVEYHLKPEKIPLDILYEDDDLLVINKPAGLVVHPASGNWDGTLVHALLYHCGDSLSGIGGVMRPGIVHRLDKDTSGLMMVAKNDIAHRHLSSQLATRTLSRIYQTIVVGELLPPIGTIDKPVGRDGRNRQKMAVREGGKEARTHYKVLERFEGALSLVECKLESGRTHQIRLHMHHLGHSVLGDMVYKAQETYVNSLLSKAGYDENVRQTCLSFPRQALHAGKITFIHPITEEEMNFKIPLPKDFEELLENLR